MFKNTTSPGNILIDYACGKGGDLPKWIKCNLNGVFGIDISKDNIHNNRILKKLLDSNDSNFISTDYIL